MLSKTHIKNAYISCLFGLCFSSNVLSDIDETFSISVGANLANYNSRLSINSQDKSINKGFSFEDDLGYNSHVNAGWISGWYRVGESHRLQLAYTPINRSSSVQNTKDIIVDNTTIKASASIQSQASTDIFDFSYIYSVHKTKTLEVGFSAGIYWLSNDTNIFAAGEIQAEGDDRSDFKSDYFTQEKIIAPMPLFGLSASYEFSRSWRSHVSLRYLNVQIDETNGSIFSAEAGSEYYFNDNWGIGTSLAYFDLDIEVKDITSKTALNWNHSSIQLYTVFKY
ncbi:MAG: hypothetical protein OQK98_08950 [Gammaproteobacteria bacterium]|nr:hypothetical protein [Gammaproteobacteria bacterium]